LFLEHAKIFFLLACSQSSALSSCYSCLQRSTSGKPMPNRANHGKTKLCYQQNKGLGRLLFCVQNYALFRLSKVCQTLRLRELHTCIFLNLRTYCMLRNEILNSGILTVLVNNNNNKNPPGQDIEFLVNPSQTGTAGNPLIYTFFFSHFQATIIKHETRRIQCKKLSKERVTWKPFLNKEQTN